MKNKIMKLIKITYTVQHTIVTCLVLQSIQVYLYFNRYVLAIFSESEAAGMVSIVKCCYDLTVQLYWDGIYTVG